MTLTDKERAPLQVPLAMTRGDRVPAARYYDPEFYAMECELLWPRVWQMACRLAEIPNPGDFVEYKILDKSIIIVRQDADTVKAFHNACRHRGVQLVKDRGTCPSGFVCSFHGWCYGLDGANTYLYQPDLFQESNRQPDDVALVPCRVETLGGSAWINFDDQAPSLRETLGHFATMADAWKTEGLWPTVYFSWNVPANWKLVNEAFMEGYHSMQTHPQQWEGKGKSRDLYRDMSMAATSPERRAQLRAGGVLPVDSEVFIDRWIRTMRTSSAGLGSPTAREIEIAESIRSTQLPREPAEAAKMWTRELNNAVMAWNERAGIDVPDLNMIVERGLDDVVSFCFPNYFMNTQWSSAFSYRTRPLGPEECLFEFWTFERFAPGTEPPAGGPVELHDIDDPRFPGVPVQDYANHVKQQLGLHQKGFEYMRLSDKVEGLIGNYHRLIDGYLAGLDAEKLVQANHRVTGAFDVPVVDIGF